MARVIDFLTKYINKPITVLFNTFEFARAVYNLVSGNTKHIFTENVPSLNDTVSITTSANVNCILFSGLLTSDFTINIAAWGSATPGDKLYIMLNSDVTSVQITFSGDIINATCGNNVSPDQYGLDGNTRIVLMFIYDGGMYVGTDNC